MARINTDKPVNLTQLGVELGRVPLRYVEGSYVDAEGVGVENLQAAVDAHVANPDYVDPDAPPPGPTRDEQLADLRTKAEALPTNNPARPLLLGLIDLT